MKVHNKCTATLIDSMGDDLRVVNAARVSFDKWSDEYKDRDDRLISYLARHGHWCYDEQTEIFTNRGWVKFTELGCDDLVAQVDTSSEKFTFDLVSPQEIHVTDYEGPMYYAKNSVTDYCVTPNHKMLIKRRSESGWKNWEVCTSDESHGREVLIRLCTEFTFPSEGDELDFLRGAYVGFILGDGARASTNRIQVKLKVERKISYFENVLSSLQFTFEKKVNSDGVSQYSIVDSETKCAKGWLKSLPDDWENMSRKFALGLMDGLNQSDGSVKNSGFAFSTGSRLLMDGYKKLCLFLGFSVKENSPRHGSGNHRLNYRCIVKSRKETIMRPKHHKIVHYKGKVGCVTVPTGFVLVRRNGLPMVCGNTPFSQVMATIRIDAPIFVARQWFKSQVGVTRNEMSRRYVDSDPEFYIPDVFHERPETGIKQGSGEVHEWSDQYVDWAVEHAEDSLDDYKALIAEGMAPEEARMFLPQNAMTQWVETGSLAYYARVCKQRLDPHAQKAIRQLAAEVSDIIESIAPKSWGALMEREV